MASIKFVKSGTKFIGEFEANSDFNLHLERNKSGSIYMQVKGTSVGNQYDSIRDVNISDSDFVFDSDFTALVYPKYIRIVSDVEPIIAEVTFNE